MFNFLNKASFGDYGDGPQQMDIGKYFCLTFSFFSLFIILFTCIFTIATNNEINNLFRVLSYGIGHPYLSLLISYMYRSSSISYSSPIIMIGRRTFFANSSIFFKTVVTEIFNSRAILRMPHPSLRCTLMKDVCLTDRLYNRKSL
jgi:hypothetical protein